MYTQNKFNTTRYPDIIYCESAHLEIVLTKMLHECVLELKETNDYQIFRHSSFS